MLSMGAQDTRYVAFAQSGSCAMYKEYDIGARVESGRMCLKRGHFQYCHKIDKKAKITALRRWRISRIGCLPRVKDSSGKFSRRTARDINSDEVMMYIVVGAMSATRTFFLEKKPRAISTPSQKICKYIAILAKNVGCMAYVSAAINPNIPRKCRWYALGKKRDAG